MKDIWPEEDGPIAEINIIPFVDIILVILIIFMVTAPLLSKMGFYLKLPQASRSSHIDEDLKHVQVFIQKDGRIYFNKEEVDLEELKRRLEVQKIQSPHLKVLVSADQNVLHGKVVLLIDLLKSLGVAEIGIEASPIPLK